MMEQIRRLWNDKPLQLIVFLAIVVRLVSVIWSKGFGMHDDHFLVIEASQSWVDGYDYNNWLPKNNPDHQPDGHSFFYVGLHYLVFSFLSWMKLLDPQVKMFVIRLLHAAFSLITVVYGFRIVRKISGGKQAKIAGLLLALYFFMPWLSVRNLVEVVCIPFLVLGIWVILNAKEKRKPVLQFLFAGLLMGLAFSVRFQTAMFAGGVGLVLLIQKQLKETVIFGLGYLASIFLVQGVVDMFIWGYPFAELKAYALYNIEHATHYITQEWYMYILLLAGILIPPVSLFIFFGFLRSWKKHLLIFLPTLIFIVFHSYFPNKQERFIIPAIPFLIMIGIAGWYEFVDKSKFWQNNKWLMKTVWIFFWVVNLAVLPFVSTMYGKKARVESMTYLSKYDGIKAILVEYTLSETVEMVPRFYLGEWVRSYDVDQKAPLKNFEPAFSERNKDKHPRFFLFYTDEELDKRVNDIKKYFPNIEFETKIEPGFVDYIMYRLNPGHNINQVVYIYRNKDFFSEKK